MRVCNRSIPRKFYAAIVIIGGTLLATSVRANPALEGYLNQESLAKQLVELDRSDLVKLESIGLSRGGRNIWALTVGSGDGPAFAVVGNVQGAHLVGSEVCLRMAQQLVRRAEADEAIRKLLQQHTFYFIPRPDPDASEKLFAAPWPLPAGNDRRTDDDRDFEIGEDPFEDLSGDGWITMMRVADDAGTHIPHPDDPRVMIAADKNKNERGRYRIYTEGRDNDGDEQWNEDAGDGVAFDRSFPFRYQPFGPNRGPHSASEPETQSLINFLFDRPRIAMIVCFSPEENVIHTWKPNGDLERQRIKTAVLGADAPAYEYFSGEYKRLSGISEVPGAGDAPGSFASWAYFHRGAWSLAIRGWSIPKVEPEGDQKPKDGRAADELNAMRWLQREKLDGFLPWKAIEHPDFPGKQVEVGGFRPGLFLNPPAKELDGLAEKHTQFLLGLPPLLPQVSISQTRVEVLGANVVRVTATCLNRGYLASMPEMGQVNGQAYPLQIALTAPLNTKFLRGSPRQRVPRLTGNGGTHEASWLLRLPGPPPASLKLQLAAPAVGASSVDLEIKGG